MSPDKPSTEKDSRSLKELLEVAITSEVEAQQRYRRLIEEDHTRHLEQLIEDFLHQEEEHKAQFKELFTDFFPEQKPEVTPESDKINVGENLEGEEATIALLNAALEAEKQSELFYKRLINRMESSQNQSLMAYPASVERGHYEAIKRN